MEPVGRVKVDREKRQTLSELIDGFEELARRFALCHTSLAQGQPLDGPRREVDSILSIQAGSFVLIALDHGYLKCSNSSAWDPRTRYKAHISELSKIRQGYTEHDKQRTELPEFLPEQIDLVASYYSRDDFVVFEKAEPIPLSQRLQELDKLLREFEEFLDPFSEVGQAAVLNAWSAFIGHELIPQNESDFRCDWRDRLPMVVDRSTLDSRPNTPRNRTWKAPGKTQDEQFRFCIQARADIYATSCRVIAKLLRAEIERRLSEIGRIHASGPSGKTDDGAKQLKRRSRKAVRAAILVEQAVRSYHKFEGGIVDQRIPPISGRELAKQSGNAFSARSVDRWFVDRFGSKKAYQSACLKGILGRLLTVKEDDARRAYGTFDPSENEVTDDHDDDDDHDD